MEQFKDFYILNKEALLFVKPGNINPRYFFTFKQFDYKNNQEIASKANSNLNHLEDFWDNNDMWIEYDIDLTKYGLNDLLEFVTDVYESIDELIDRNEDNSNLEVARLIFEQKYLE